MVEVYLHCTTTCLGSWQ